MTTIQRRRFLQSVAMATGVGVVGATPPAHGEPAAGATGAVRLLANDFTIVHKVANPRTTYAYSPGIAVLPSRRIVATMDEGGKGAGQNRCKVYTSDNQGQTWTRRAALPMVHARPFFTRDGVYVLGHAGDLRITRSTDNGTTFSPLSRLTENEHWHAAPTNVYHTDRRVYMVYELRANRRSRGWPVATLAPVVLAAPQDANLTQPDAWTFSNKNLVFEDALAVPSLMGAPRFHYGNLTPGSKHDRRYNAPAGWLEANVVRIVDPDHIWQRSDGVRLHVFLRAHLGGVANVAALCQADENADGSITMSLVKTPAGQTQGFLPLPGGHLKFHIDYDPISKTYWLISNRCTDSMRRPDRLPEGRYNIPLNQRDMLDLYFSTNAVDWSLAGRVAHSPGPGQPRNYPSLAFDGDDLYVLSRSGDEHSKSAHDGNFISFHVVKNFRETIY